MSKPIDLAKYSLIFFDVDNTLIDTVGDMRRMITETLEHAGDVATDEVVNGFFEANSRWWHRYHEGEITDLAELRLGRFIDLVRDFSLTGDPEAMSVEYRRTSECRKEHAFQCAHQRGSPVCKLSLLYDRSQRRNRSGARSPS